MRGQRKNPRKAVQPFENKKRKIDIFKNYEANGVEKIQRKLEIFSTLISKKSRFYSMEVIQYQKECLCLTYDLVNRQALAHKCDFCTNNNPKYQIFGIVKNSQSSFCKTTS